MNAEELVNSLPVEEQVEYRTSLAARGITAQQDLDEYMAIRQKAFAEAWLDGKAPGFMYEPPFYRGMVFTDRKTGEEIRVESQDARADFGILHPMRPRRPILDPAERLF